MYIYIFASSLLFLFRYRIFISFVPSFAHRTFSIQFVVGVFVAFLPFSILHNVLRVCVISFLQSYCMCLLLFFIFLLNKIDKNLRNITRVFHFFQL